MVRSPTVLLLGDNRIGGHHGCNAVVLVIIEQFRQRGIRVVSSVDKPRLIQTFSPSEIDAIIVNGEGSIHGRTKNAVLFSEICRTAHAAQIPFVVLNSVLSKCAPEVIDGLRLSSMFYCREGLSKEYADSYEIPNRLCPDLTFALQAKERFSWRRGQRILVTDSTINARNRVLHKLAMDGGLEFLPLRTTPDMVSYRNPHKLFRFIKFHILHNLGRLASGQFMTDRFGKAKLTLDDFIADLVRGTKFVLTGRFHGVCFCLSFGVPFLAVSSNTPKIEGLLRDAELEAKLVDLNSLYAERSEAPGANTNEWQSAYLIEQLSSRAHWSEQDEKKRMQYLKKAELAIRDCFDYVTELVLSTWKGKK